MRNIFIKARSSMCLLMLMLMLMILLLLLPALLATTAAAASGSAAGGAAGTAQKYIITVVAGSGCSVEGGGEYDAGAQVTLTVLLKDNYILNGWFDGDELLSDDETYIFTATENKTIIVRLYEIVDLPPDHFTEVKPRPVPLLDKSGDRGYISGYTDGTVRAENYLTRYETVVLLYNIVSNADKASYTDIACYYNDVADGQWYSEAVGFFAAARYLLSGYDGLFSGETPTTRAQFVAFVSQFNDEDPDGDAPFNDTRSHWANKYIAAAYNNGWVSGYRDGSFAPDNKITRGEVIVIINKMLGWPGAAPKAGISFTDLSGAEWYYEDIIKAANGIAKP